MNYRLLLLAALALAFGLGAECSPVNGDTAQGATGGPSACGNVPSVADTACSACLSAMCADETAAAYGPDWRAGTYAGGVCSAVLACECACPAYDETCLAACDARSGLDCQTAKAKVGTCVQAARCSCI